MALTKDNPMRSLVAKRMKVALHRLEKYGEMKEKADDVTEWNDMIHDLHDLVDEFGADLPSQLRENIQTILNYTEPPQTEITSDIDSVKSDLEEAIDVYQDTSQSSGQRNPISKSTIILTGITVALVIAASVVFYLTQYSISTLRIENMNCEPLKFQETGQPFKLVKLPGSPIMEGGYAQAVIPAGTLTIDNTAENKLRLGYIFGLNLYIALPENVSDIRLNDSQALTHNQMSIDVPKDGNNSITISCS